MLKEKLTKWWKQEAALSIPIKHCKICFQEINDDSFYNLFHKQNDICEDCFKKFSAKFIEFKIRGIKALSIYEYDQNIKDILYKFKGCFDIEIGVVFFQRYLPFLKNRYKGYYIVPVPSYHLEDIKRGFNHVEEMYSRLELPMLKVLVKTKNIKQAKLRKKERMKTKNRFEIIDKNILKDKKILVVDDVYTTGSSMKAALELVKTGKPRLIEVLVMSKNILKPKK